MEQLTQEFIENHCRDRRSGYPVVFDKSYGLDVVIPNHPEYKVEPPQRYVATIRVSTFRGVSMGAIHYYGRIEATAPEITCIGSRGEKCTIGGYICEEWKKMSDEEKKFVGERYEIELVRPVTQNEIDEDPDRWYGYDAGDKTNGFYSKEEIFSLAKKIIEYRFPGWEIELDDWCD